MAKNREEIVVKEESWIRAYWRPMMAWQYFLVCLCDFIIFPLAALWFAKQTGTEWHWDPMTLKESGFYHIAMGLIIGVAAWTRGQENLLRTRIFAYESPSSKRQCEDDDLYMDEEEEGMDPPAHPTPRRRKGG